MLPATLAPVGTVSYLDDTMGAMLIGVIVSALLHGITLVQGFYYIVAYPKDALYIKWLVAATIILDTVHLSLVTHTVYHYLITQYFEHRQLTLVVWSVLVEALPAGSTGALVQLFYTMRVWRLSNKNHLLVGIILVLIMANMGCGIAWVAISLRLETFERLLSISPLTITINALSCVADILIAGSLCFFLRRARTGFKKSDSMINKLTLFVINTGVLTSCCALCSLIFLIASPNTLLYAAFYFCIGRFYTNSFLATLNARQNIRGSLDDTMLVSLPPSILSTSNTVTHVGSKAGHGIAIRIDPTRDMQHDRKSRQGYQMAHQTHMMTLTELGVKHDPKLDEV